MDSENKKNKICCVLVFFLYQATTVYLCCLWEIGDLWLKLAIPVIFMKPSKKQYLEAMADLPGSHKTITCY